jgi:hypothetical protein
VSRINASLTRIRCSASVKMRSISSTASGAPSKASLGASAGALSLERTTPIGRKAYGYTAPGSGHTVLSDEPFYTEEVNGQRFVDWVTRLIERKPVDDVHCRQCRVG